MIIFYGARRGGRIDGYRGQYAVTRFAHIYWLPLFPIGSRWISGGADGLLTGHAIRLSGRGVLAGYLRSWGLLVGIGLCAAAPWPGKLVGGALLAGALGTLAWLKVRGARAQRERELFGRATGTFCGPAALPARLVDVLRRELEERWAAAARDRTPRDVARFGPRDTDEAALAYALLVLTARLDRKQAAELHALAGKLVDSSFEPLASEGPYRGLPATSLGASAEPAR